MVPLMLSLCTFLAFLLLFSVVAASFAQAVTRKPFDKEAIGLTLGGTIVLALAMAAQCT